MGWETRARGGRYYTRSRREGGRVVREYVGCGVVGELAAAEDDARRAERTIVRAELDRARDIHAEIARLHSVVDQLMRGALLTAGFEHYKRQWRKRRDDPTNDSAR